MNFDVTKFTKQIDKVIEYLAQKLQMPVGKALEILHKEYIYRLCLDGLWFLVGILLIIGGFLFIKFFWKKDEDGDYSLEDNELQFWMSWIGGIAIIIGIFTMFINGISLLHGLINPEWYIYMEIIKPMIQ